MPASEQDWEQDRDRFVADTHSRDHGAPLGPLALQFATLTYSLLDAGSVADVLEQVVSTTAEVVPGADLVSVTLRSHDGRFHTPVETDPIATELDQLQYEFGEGPCLEAAEDAGPRMAVSADLSAERKWPCWGPAVTERGIAAVMSTELVPDPQPPRLSGSLNIYSRQVQGLAEESANVALLLATHASLALARVDAVTVGQLKAEQLSRSVDSRDVIGQAKGILMSRRGMSAGQAFDLLRSTSNELNIKLVQLAETVAARHHDLDLPGKGDR